MKLSWLRFIRPSTRAFTTEARRLPGYSVFDWLPRLVYPRWPYLYTGTGEHPPARWLAPIARTLVDPQPKQPAGTRHIRFADTYYGIVTEML